MRGEIEGQCADMEGLSVRLPFIDYIQEGDKPDLLVTRNNKFFSAGCVALKSGGFLVCYSPENTYKIEDYTGTLVSLYFNSSADAIDYIAGVINTWEEETSGPLHGSDTLGTNVVINRFAEFNEPFFTTEQGKPVGMRMDMQGYLLLSRLEQSAHHIPVVLMQDMALKFDPS